MTLVSDKRATESARKRQQHVIDMLDRALGFNIDRMDDARRARHAAFPAAERARRRRANKIARASRKANR